MINYDRRMDLNGKWDFAPGHLQCDNPYQYIFDYPETRWTEIEVPYCWNGSKWMSVLGSFHLENGYYKDGGVPPFKNHLDVGWYRKKIMVPQKWQGLRIHIRFMAVAARALLWVNGDKVGEHLGAYSAFGFDITDFIDYSAENTILVKVWGKHCFYPYDQRSFDQGGIHMFVPGRTLEIPVGETRDNAGICQPVEIFATGPVYIEDLDIARTADPVKVKVKLAGKYKGKESFTVKVSLMDKKTSEIIGSEARQTRFPNENMVLTYIFRELDVKLWSPESPTMYTVRAEIEEEGRSLCVAAKDTGFKEFEIRNHKFYLNKKPYFLRGAGSPVSPVIMYDEEYIFKFLRMCKELHLNCIRFHTEPPSQAWMKGCDELGLLAIYEMPLMQQTPDIANTRREFKELVHQCRHHPCIAMYCLSNETNFLSDVTRNMTGYETMAAYFNDLRAAVLEEDDTLPVYHDAGYCTDVECGNGDIRDWHIYGGWYDNCIFSFEAIMKGTAMMEMLSPAAGSSVIPGEKEDRRSRKFWRDMHKPVILTEFLAAYTADDGHLLQYPLKIRRTGKYEDAGNERSLWFQAFLLKEIVEILRRCRDETNHLSGISPFALFNWFFYPLDKDRLAYKPAALALKEVMEPTHASIRCWSRHKFGQSDLKAEIFLIHDDAEKGTIEDSIVHYSIRDREGRPLTEGQLVSNKVDYYGIEKIPLTISLPEIEGDDMMDARLEVVWQKGDEILSKNTMDLLLAPSSMGLPIDSGSCCEVQIYDSTGETIPVLDRMGIRYKKVTGISEIDSPVPAVIIGMNAYESLTDADKICLNRLTKNGATILILEQNVYDEGRNPIRIDWIDGTPISIIREGDHIDDFVYVTDFSVPVFKKLMPEHFRMWNGNTVVISSYIKQGTEENHKPARTLFGSRAGYRIDKLPNVKTHVECFNFLRYDGLVEIPLGNGRVILNQLEACRRYGDDPVATIYLKNLLQYVLSSGN